MNYINVTEVPDFANIEREGEWSTVFPQNDRMILEDLQVSFIQESAGLSVHVTAERSLSRIVLRWRKEIGQHVRILGDHWERGYGDLAFQPITPERELPWYFLYSDGLVCHGAGVLTGPSAFCHWRVDSTFISLVLDLRCGGDGVLLNGRVLQAATIVSRQGRPGESAFSAACAFCRQMCAAPLLPPGPVYGGNNWYFAYGKSSFNEILRDSRLVAELADGCPVRPYMVIDMNWHSPYGDWHAVPHDPWTEDNPDFPDMARLAREMKELGVRPGLWFRPLLTSCSLPKEWLLNAGRQIGANAEGLILDPSLPEVLDLIGGYMRRFADWGYELVKHDFTSYDIAGRWGFQKPGLTDSGWHFRDQSRTTAEIVLELYRTIERNRGDMLLIGCNTYSHLAAGLVHIQRTGDDTSGKQWERTRKMGINTLAFRMPQHRAFYASDADCAAITPNVPWAQTRQWLDLVANSGTPLFVSMDPAAMGSEQKAAVTEAFRAASVPQAAAEPLDWEDCTCPILWKIHGEQKKYCWTDTGKLEDLGL